MIGVILTIAIFLFTGFMAVMKGQKLFLLFLTIFAFSLTFEMVVSTYGQTSTTMAIALGAAVVAAILAQYAEKFAFFLLVLFLAQLQHIFIKSLFVLQLHLLGEGS